MEFNLFRNKDRYFVIAMFIEKSDLERNMREIESLGDRSNINLTVQPCPFEGIEFLYRVSKDLMGHFLSLEKDVFWEAIELKGKVPEDLMKKIAEHHLNYLTAILEQDAKKIKHEGLKLKEYETHFIKPLASVVSH